MGTPRPGAACAHAPPRPHRTTARALHAHDPPRILAAELLSLPRRPHTLAGSDVNPGRNNGKIGCEPGARKRRCGPLLGGVTANTSHENRLTMLMAATRRARDAQCSEAQTVAEHVNWSALANQLRARRLLPLLGERIAALVTDRASAEFEAAVHDAIAVATAQDRFQESVTIQLLDALIAAGVPALAVKGPMLGKLLYGRPGRRPSADIDLLVRREQLSDAIRIAVGIGYRASGIAGPEQALPLLQVRVRHRPLVGLFRTSVAPSYSGHRHRRAPCPRAVAARCVCADRPARGRAACRAARCRTGTRATCAAGGRPCQSASSPHYQAAGR